ncbi:cilia- and flagella-associated protein 97 [Periophthalmus magnuspinnatus]|uniref:cilia- and flagella-associated protein 97 n=1 Tax=Periophthalmus magnuspinnatus TaxID=409849 RepID=UPI00145B8E96|nr:cilia- and flagella-associated protein 97 [Periophthalmus magnuspinnatus]
MFSPSELEGEVDHTFFDSDCEDGKAEDGKKVNTTSTTTTTTTTTTETDISATSKKIQPKPADSIICILDDGANKEPRSVNNNSKGLERKDDCKEVPSTNSNKHFMAMLADAKYVDEDGKGVRNSGSKNKNAQVNKKQVTYGWRPSSASSEAKDTESASTSGHSESRAGSAASRDAHSVSSEEPNDIVTDVSPLSSPASSRLQSLNLNHSETEDDSVEQQQSVPSSGLYSAQRHENFSQDEDDYSLSSVSRLDSNVVVQFPGSRHRKNYTFSNDEVKRIDRENQRLLQQLSRCSSGLRPGSAAGQRHCVTSSKPPNRVSHSSLNRLREQQRIERDNLAFLKRLESVKPTPGMKRSEQLADYQRQAGYLGIRSIYQTTTKKSSSIGHIQNKPPHHGARSTSTATELSSTPASRTRKPKAAPPAWS